ncbi:MAG: hypothetical protein IJN57_02615 [Oscillospiraceae bacterium]|nr:hypothetical protein [Oscillospiraceae bacterium]
MKMKKYLAALMAVTMICGAFTACGGGETASETESKADSSSAVESVADPAAESETEESKAPVAVTQPAAPTNIEESVSATSGQAYLAITDSQWWVQYWGDATDGKSHMLSYNAGVCDITGDGQYTVSVTADTNGFRYDTTGDVNGVYTPGGLGFAAVIIKDGETVCPDAIITIDSIKIDGTEIEMVAKNYTNFEEGAIRTNIFNEWVSSPTSDARCAEGFLYTDYDTNAPALDNVADFSAQIVNRDDFNAWTTIEVNFTITGMGGAAEGGDAGEGQPAAEGEGPAAEGEEAAAESVAE